MTSQHQPCVCVCVSFLCAFGIPEHSRWKLLFFGALDISLHWFFSLSHPPFRFTLSLDTVSLIFIQSQAESPRSPTAAQSSALTVTSGVLWGGPILVLPRFVLGRLLLSFYFLFLLLFLVAAIDRQTERQLEIKKTQNNIDIVMSPRVKRATNGANIDLIDDINDILMDINVSLETPVR